MERKRRVEEWLEGLFGKEWPRFQEDEEGVEMLFQMRNRFLEMEERSKRMVESMAQTQQYFQTQGQCDRTTQREIGRADSRGWGKGDNIRFVLEGIGFSESSLTPTADKNLEVLASLACHLGLRDVRGSCYLSALVDHQGALASELETQKEFKSKLERTTAALNNALVGLSETRKMSKRLVDEKKKREPVLETRKKETAYLTQKLAEYKAGLLAHKVGNGRREPRNW